MFCNFPAVFQLANSDVTGFLSDNFPIIPASYRVTTMKLKKQHFSTSNISAIVSPIGLKRQNMFIWFLINTLHYSQMEKKNVEILVHLTFKLNFVR